MPAKTARRVRRRVDVSLRLEEAKAVLAAVEDALVWHTDVGAIEDLLDADGPSRSIAGRLRRAATKLRKGLVYVTGRKP